MDRLKLYVKAFKRALIRSIARVAKKGGNLGKALYLCTILPILLGIDFLVDAFEKMITHKKLSRVAAGALSFAMVFTSVGLFAVYADVNDTVTAQDTIVSIGALSEDVAVQKLEMGASEDEIVFPDTLSVTVEKAVAEEKDLLEEEEPEEITEEVVEEPEEPEETSVEETAAPEEVDAAPVVDETPQEETPVEEAAPAEEVPAEVPVETPVEAPVETPAEPVAPEGDPSASIIDFLFPAITVYAAEPETMEEVTAEAEASEGAISIEEVLLSGITWRIVPERSTAAEFDSTISGAAYVYVPNIPAEYAVACSLPTITVFVAEEMAFEQSIVVDGVKITVKADKGVFPEGATVVARRATAEEETIADAAVDTEREAVNIASSYTFDITVYDKMGNEIQPNTAKGRVKVAFELAEASDTKLDAEVYHITNENPATPEAEKLVTENYSNTLEVETTGFSMYTVEFTYNGLQFVLDGNTEAYLSDVLEQIGITGTITDAKSSNEELFKAFYVRDNWKIAALKAFSTYETLTVVVDDVTYEIEVTDSQYTVSDGSFVYDTDNEKSAASLVSMVLSDGVAAQNAKRTGTVNTFTNGMADLGINSGIILDTSGDADAANDADLQALVSSLGYNYGGHTSTLEFEMTATGKLLNFNYVFASREFTESSNYNDAFGLFVSVNGGAYENIALITRDNGTQVPVTIVNLRAGTSGTEMSCGQGTDPASGTHSLFHYTTIALQEKESAALNGISNVFNAQKAVNIGDKVKIKFAICDCGDTAYNSYVFIEAGSLSFEAPNSQVNYEEEVLKGLDAGDEYEVTCDGEKYVFTASSDGTIPLSGTDKNGKSYNFIGKTVSIIKKGTGDTEDSEAQEVEISDRPEAVEANTNGSDMEEDVVKPADVGADAIVTSETRITLNIDTNDAEKMGQQYRIYDDKGQEMEGYGWVSPNAAGEVVFSGLTNHTKYTVRARKKATSSAPASLPSKGITVTTIGTIAVAEPLPSEISGIDYDGSERQFGVTTEEGVEITYSTELNANYSSTIPTFKDAGTYVVYYKATKEGYRTVYGNFTVTIDKLPKDNVEKDDIAYLVMDNRYVKERTVDLSSYLEKDESILAAYVDGDIEKYINITGIDGKKLTYEADAEGVGAEGHIILRVGSTNYEDYYMFIPVKGIQYVPPVVEQPQIFEPETVAETPVSIPTNVFAAEDPEEETDKTKKETAFDALEEISLLEKGNIVDSGEIWNEVSDTTKAKLLEKLDEKSGEIFRVDEALTLQTENADKIIVKNKPIALVMGEGAIVVTMEVTDTERTSASLADANAVAKALLTEEQLAQVSAGSVFEIKVEVTPIENDAVPELDAQVISDGAAEYAESNPNMAMADYIDISMYFRIDDADWEQITETEAFDIVIDIPDQYKGLGSAYYIIRAHEGKSTLLSDLDDNDDTITISTGQFSTYALMYDEIRVAETIEEKHDCYMHWIIFMLAIVGMAGVAVFRKDRRAVYAITGVDAGLMVILTILGSCGMDYLALVVGIVAFEAMAILTNTKEEEN